MLDPTIFRAYDIRGVVEDSLTKEVAYQVGRAFAAEAQAARRREVLTGRDGRLSGPALHEALNQGLAEGGMDVLDIGLAPTPVLYFAAQTNGAGAAVMVTGSHNPGHYNGFKMVLGGKPLSESAIQGLRSRILTGKFSQGQGCIRRRDFLESYSDAVAAQADLRGAAPPLKVVVDCGNGVASLIAPKLLHRLGCEVVELFCAVDGAFPNHNPDPAEPENLQDLISEVQATGAHCGLAFDGDGDRLGVVTDAGEIIWPDRLMMLFAQDILRRQPGAEIIYDVKCSRALGAFVQQAGGRPRMWRTGHSHIKAKLRETGAPLGGEFSGHICFADRWFGFDDALYAAVRLLELLRTSPEGAQALFQELPVGISTPEIKVHTTETNKFPLMEALANQADFGDGKRTTVDGLRIDYKDGWGLVRASNTTPTLTLRFEADGQAALDRIRNVFQTQLRRIDPSLAFQDAP